VADRTASQAEVEKVRIKHLRSILLITVCGVMLVSCGGGQPKDLVLRGELVASDTINPNRDGRASPVTVVIYHLKSAEAFMLADFFNLYQADSGVVAADLIKRIDMQVQPGQSLELSSEFDPETTHIGILAAFRDIDNATWRTLVEMPEKSLTDKLNPFAKKKLIVQIDELAVAAKVE
jgi:type VI secretion system protein VasD